MDIKITGMTMVAKPKLNAGGDCIMAYLDFVADFVTVRGAVLVRLSTGSWTVWEPHFTKDDRLPFRSVKLDGAVRRAVADAAIPVFETLGIGVDATAMAAE